MLLKQLIVGFGFFYVAVHYGADLATPININTSLQAQSDISDALWDFVSTKW